LLQNAPHPNAAKIFVNWLLSREGQTEVQKGRKGRPRTGSNSLRTDILKNSLPEEIQRKDGVDYFDADDDSNADRRPADKLFNEIFSKASK
jgi:ABC-type Fe3+ transport system substrate-binding protein